MKTSVILYSILIAGMIGISGCGGENKELKNDTKEIAGVMCKSMEAMKNLKMVDPADSAMVKQLQLVYQGIQGEMTLIYQKFREKYGEKTNSVEFNKTFSQISE